MHSTHATERVAAPASAHAPLLALEQLSVTFATPRGALPAVRGLTLAIGKGECVGVVGESGAGKSQAFLAPLGLTARNAQVTGSARFGELELIGAPERRMNEIRGARIGVLFQDPMSSLTPHMRIGRQIAEPLVRHRGSSAARARARALELLRRVRIAEPERRLEQYPHELSGGMRQRVALAIALACEPELLIADEPTTALDATVQAQMLALLAELRDERSLTIVLISHDMAAVAGLADRIAVLYGGALVELGAAPDVLGAPRHPYTRALLAAVPRLGAPRTGALDVIRGQPPDPRHLPSGCVFHPRCPRAAERCRRTAPMLASAVAGAGGGGGLSPASGSWLTACHFPHESEDRRSEAT